MPKKRAAGKQTSLADKAKTMAPPPRHTYQPANFVDRLPPEQQEQLYELREQFISGELGIYWTPRTLLHEIVEPAGINIGVSLQTWRKWLHERNHR